MANVIYLQPVPYNESLAPGQESEWWLGPMDAYRHSTIMVTAHAYEPLYEDTMMSVGSCI